MWHSIDWRPTEIGVWLYRHMVRVRFACISGTGVTTKRGKHDARMQLLDLVLLAKPYSRDVAQRRCALEIGFEKRMPSLVVNARGLHGALRVVQAITGVCEVSPAKLVCCEISRVQQVSWGHFREALQGYDL